MDEFHVSSPDVHQILQLTPQIHHPGPGSWLDKATAALAKGQKLPEAHDYDTA
jgi:hypothetical protein